MIPKSTLTDDKDIETPRQHQASHEDSDKDSRDDQESML